LFDDYLNGRVLDHLQLEDLFEVLGHYNTNVPYDGSATYLAIRLWCHNDSLLDLNNLDLHVQQFQ
jgi:hypothetical protein